jgi:hypothetical protein
MRGPVLDPTGRSTDFFFVCDRCKTKMQDRRSRSEILGGE